MFLGHLFLSLLTGLFAFLVLGFSLGMFQVPLLELFFWGISYNNASFLTFLPTHTLPLPPIMILTKDMLSPV